MRVEIDSDVEAVAAFMQRHLPAQKLISVSEAQASLAPALWGHVKRSEVRALFLEAESPISSCERQIRPAST